MRRHAAAGHNRSANSLRAAILLCATLSCSAIPASTGTAADALRCGWFDNPSPANVALRDRDGEWIVGIQGGHQAKGDWPRFRTSEWVRTGAGSYGYGCACLRVRVDAESHEVKQIFSASARPLAACRKDPALKGTEPQNPLQ